MNKQRNAPTMQATLLWITMCGTVACGQGATTTSGATAGMPSTQMQNGGGASETSDVLYKNISPLTDSYAFRGRFDMTDPNNPQFEWENAAVGVQVSNTTQVTVTLNNVQNRDLYNWVVVLVDGQIVNKIKFQAGVSQYVAADNLTLGQHTIWLSKGQEFGFGPVAFGGVQLDPGGKILSPPVLPPRRLEFIGSSTLSGWGADSVLDSSLDCNDEVNFPTTDAERSIPAYAAQILSADFQNLSRGAGGIMCTFTPGVDLLPTTYPNITDSDVASWDFTQWSPDAVIIEAGGSDFTAGDGPPATAPVGTLVGYPGANATAMQTYSLNDFINAYRQFLETIRSHYPRATIVLVDTKDFSSQSLTVFRQALDTVAAGFSDGKVVRFNYFTTPLSTPSQWPDYATMTAQLGLACDGHDTPQESEYLAGRLADFLKNTLAW